MSERINGSASERRLQREPLVVAGATAALLFATSARYDYHRDELYFRETFASWAGTWRGGTSTSRR